MVEGSGKRLGDWGGFTGGTWGGFGIKKRPKTASTREKQIFVPRQRGPVKIKRKKGKTMARGGRGHIGDDLHCTEFPRKTYSK